MLPCGSPIFLWRWVRQACPCSPSREQTVNWTREVRAPGAHATDSEDGPRRSLPGFEMQALISLAAIWSPRAHVLDPALSLHPSKRSLGSLTCLLSQRDVPALLSMQLHCHSQEG